MLPPLLTYFTAGIFAVTGRQPVLYYLIPFAAYLASLFMLWRIGERLFGAGAGVFAALLAGLHPTMMLTSLSFNSHSVAPCLNLAALLLFLSALKDERRWVPLMILLGIGRLLRLENIALAGVFPVFAWILRWRFPQRVTSVFGAWFWLGILAWFLVTLPYHAWQGSAHGNPLYPFELGLLREARRPQIRRSRGAGEDVRALSRGVLDVPFLLGKHGPWPKAH